MRAANKQHPYNIRKLRGSFVIEGGRVVRGRDPILCLLEVVPGVCDLLFPREMADGTYATGLDAVTRRHRDFENPDFFTRTTPKPRREHTQSERNRRRSHETKSLF
jgi:hypothetical protein